MTALHVEALRAAAAVVAGDASVPAAEGGGRLAVQDLRGRTLALADDFLAWLRANAPLPGGVAPRLATGGIIGPRPPADTTDFQHADG